MIVASYILIRAHWHAPLEIIVARIATNFSESFIVSCAFV